MIVLILSLLNAMTFSKIEKLAISAYVICGPKRIVRGLPSQ